MKALNYEDLIQALDVLQDKSIKIDTQTWNRRYKEYTDKLATGSLSDVAQVLRDLNVLKVDKELSFGEKKMLEKARTYLTEAVNAAQIDDDSEFKVVLLKSMI